VPVSEGGSYLPYGIVCLECLTEEERRDENICTPDHSRRIKAIEYQDEVVADFYRSLQTGEKYLGVQPILNARKPGVGPIKQI